MEPRKTRMKKRFPLFKLCLLLICLLIPILLWKPVTNWLSTSQQFSQEQHKAKNAKTSDDSKKSSTKEDIISTEQVEWKPQEEPVRIPILMYHAIHTMDPSEAHNANLIVAPELFEEHIKGLKEAGYYFLTPDEAYKALTENSLPNDKVVWLTFDDSLWDFYQFAYPIMQKYKARGTNNVITGFTEENGYPGHLTLEQMIEMAQHGMSFQSHTVNHPDLSQQDYQTQNSELELSKHYLDTQLNQDTIAIAYPSGRYSDDTLSIASSHYKLGLTTNEGLASLADGLLSLNRVRILPTTDVNSLLANIATRP